MSKNISINKKVVAALDLLKVEGQPYSGVIKQSLKDNKAVWDKVKHVFEEEK